MVPPRRSRRASASAFPRRPGHPDANRHRSYPAGTTSHPQEVSQPRARLRSVATWTIVHAGQPVAWASRSRWASQPRPLRGADSASVPPPFRGVTLADRHPADPLLPYTEEERRALCSVCNVPVIHRSAHLRGPLHRARMELSRAVRASESDFAAAIALIQRERPQLLHLPEQRPPPVALLDDNLIDLPEEEMLEN